MSYNDLAEREAAALRTANEQRHAYGLPPIQFEEEIDGEECPSGESGGAGDAGSDGRKGSRRSG